MIRWTPDSNVTDVLALGPRTAGRLLRLGIRTAEHLLAAKPHALAHKLAEARITPETIAEWQRETRLVMVTPGLSTDAARLLAALGFSTAERIAGCTPTELIAAVEQLQLDNHAEWLAKDFCPALSEVSQWIHCARVAVDECAA